MILRPSSPAVNGRPSTPWAIASPRPARVDQKVRRSRCTVAQTGADETQIGPRDVSAGRNQAEARLATALVTLARAIVRAEADDSQRVSVFSASQVLISDW